MAETVYRIDYVEISVSSTDSAKRFYGEAFGWTFTDYGPAYTEFTDGHMKGGFDAGSPVKHGGPLVVLYATDLDTIEKRVTAAGGAISTPTFAFPGGRRFHFTDPDGNELAVWGPEAA